MEVNDDDDDKGNKIKFGQINFAQINFACIVSISFVAFEKQNPFR